MFLTKSLSGRQAHCRMYKVKHKVTFRPFSWAWSNGPCSLHSAYVAYGR